MKHLAINGIDVIQIMSGSYSRSKETSKKMSILKSQFKK